MRIALLVIGCALTGCSSSSNPGTAGDGGTGSATTIRASDYDQSCTKDDDCALAYSGDVCGCTCPNDPISKRGQQAYSAQLQQLRGQCRSRPAIACDCGALSEPMCATEGKCTTRPINQDAGADGG
jgi:hypothetical protein